MSPSVKRITEEALRFRQQTLSGASRILIGYGDILDLVLVSAISGGHILLTGLPGLGKTLLVKTLSRLWDLSFRRIQFTPDLMPADISGTEILQEKTTTRGSSRFLEFVPGPVFANLVLADEINRTPPRTQSALLQAMEERQVSVANHTHTLPQPFLVMATQNPLELEGTYPLPEAQLDRFLLSLELSYPSREAEIQIAKMSMGGHDLLDSLQPIAHADTILQLQKSADKVAMPESLLSAIVDAVRSTRQGSAGADMVLYGAGPRSVQFLVRAARARALLTGRPGVSEEEIAFVFPNILRHRIQLKYEAVAEGISVDDLLQRINPFA